MIDKDTNTYLIKEHKKQIRKINKRMNEIKQSIELFTNNSFDDVSLKDAKHLINQLKLEFNSLQVKKAQEENTVSILNNLN